MNNSIMKIPTFSDNNNPIKDANELIKFLKNIKIKIFSFFADDNDKILCRGDIIGICRGLYYHYGVYNNAGSVIHYSSKESDTGSNNSIIETDLKTFMKGDNDVFKLVFPEEHDIPEKIIVNNPQALSSFNKFTDFKQDIEYKLYSPDETVSRAKSRLGERKYDLVFNNCEHFAIWCKTGISESHQVNELLSILQLPQHQIPFFDIFTNKKYKTLLINTHNINNAAQSMNQLAKDMIINQTVITEFVNAEIRMESRIKNSLNKIDELGKTVSTIINKI